MEMQTEEEYYSEAGANLTEAEADVIPPLSSENQGGDFEVQCTSTASQENEDLENEISDTVGKLRTRTESEPPIRDQAGLNSSEDSGIHPIQDGSLHQIQDGDVHLIQDGGRQRQRKQSAPVPSLVKLTKKRKSVTRMLLDVGNFPDAVIRNAEMDEDWQHQAVSIAAQCIAQDELEGDIAETLKEHFDELYQPNWHCIVGKNFGCFVTHDKHNFIYFYIGPVAILLFKSG